jgi:hypothetical protein
VLSKKVLRDWVTGGLGDWGTGEAQIREALLGRIYVREACPSDIPLARRRNLRLAERGVAILSAVTCVRIQSAVD